MEFLKGVVQGFHQAIDGKILPSIDFSGKVTTICTLAIKAMSLVGIVDANSVFTLLLTIVSVTYVSLKAYSMILEIKERKLRIKNQDPKNQEPGNQDIK